MKNFFTKLLKIPTKVRNFFLYLRFPFIKYNRGYTLLDEIPKGWKKAFGIQMCKEIKEALLREGGRKALKAYRVTDVKEKYGSLQWYDEYGNDEVSDIIVKYECISSFTCVICGRPAKYQAQDWICPYCEDHIGRRPNKRFWYDLDFYGYKAYRNDDSEEN